jgi:hypothetical protein
LPHKYKREIRQQHYFIAEAIAVPAGGKTFKAALWTNNRQISPTVGQSCHPAVRTLFARSPKIENRAPETKQKKGHGALPAKIRGKPIRLIGSGTCV